MNRFSRALRVSVFLLPGAWSVALAAEWEWQTFTNATDVRQILAADSLVWAATNGGLLRFSPATGRLRPL
ncbi:MAG TPA: hypothetical protein PLG50_06940 [bacterium]|nr:hypothetical protein [bacterium]